MRIKEKLIFKDAGHYHNKIYKLKELQALKSLSRKKLIPERAESFHDFVFWAIKLFCEDIIKTQGLAAYEQLENFALGNFSSKETSTLRAKCRSIWNWYEQRDWQLSGYKRKYNSKKQLKELQMTRTERALENNKLRTKKAKLKILDATTGLLKEEYKKVNGSWNISKMAKELNMARDTIKKYINEN